MIQKSGVSKSLIPMKPGAGSPGGITGGSYRDVLAAMVEALKPGGEIERGYAKDIDREGKLLGSQLEAGSISRGLGNARTGIPTTVFKQTSQAKQKLRGEMTGQYVGALQNLAQLMFQEEQANLNRSTAMSANAPTGLDAFGRPMRGTLAAAELDLANKQIQALSSKKPSIQSFPSLAAAGGYGGGSVAEAPSLFGDVAGSSATPMTWEQPIYGSKGFGEVYGFKTPRQVAGV